MSDDEENLTPKQIETKVRDFEARCGEAVSELNRIVRELAYLGKESKLELTTQDGTKYQVEQFPGQKNIQGLPKKVKGPKYPQIIDVTNIPNRETD